MKKFSVYSIDFKLPAHNIQKNRSLLYLILFTILLNKQRKCTQYSSFVP